MQTGANQIRSGNDSPHHYTLRLPNPYLYFMVDAYSQKSIVRRNVRF
jgi:hypothetical protein